MPLVIVNIVGMTLVDGTVGTHDESVEGTANTCMVADKRVPSITTNCGTFANSVSVDDGVKVVVVSATVNAVVRYPLEWKP